MGLRVINLDTAFGHDLLALRVALKRFGFTADLIGTESNPRYMRPDAVDVLEGNVRRELDRAAMGLKENSFDLVTIQNIGDEPDLLMRAAARLLRPGGLMTITFETDDIRGKNRSYLPTRLEFQLKSEWGMQVMRTAVPADYPDAGRFTFQAERSVMLFAIKPLSTTKRQEQTLERQAA